MDTAGALEHQELMSEGKDLRLQRCSSLKSLPSRRNQQRMIVSMSPKSYSDGCLNSTSSVRTEFLVGTAVVSQARLGGLHHRYDRAA